MATRTASTEIDIPQEILDWESRGLVMKAGGLTPVEEYLRRLKEKGKVTDFDIDLIAWGCGAARTGVGITDTVFIQDQNRHGRSILDRMGGDVRAVERLRRGLAANGYTLKSDDHYIPTVASKQYDPAAVVNHTTGLGELRRRLESQGRGMEGEINLKAREVGPRKPIHKLAPHIVERIRQRMIKEDPGLAHKDQRELREAIIDKHGVKTK